MMKMFENDENLLDINDEVSISDSMITEDIDYKHHLYFIIQTQNHTNFRLKTMFDNGIFSKTYHIFDSILENEYFIENYKITFRTDLGKFSDNFLQDTFIVDPQANMVEYDRMIFTNKDMFYKMTDDKLKCIRKTSTVQYHIYYNISNTISMNDIISFIKKMYNACVNFNYLVNMTVAKQNVGYCMLVENFNSSMFSIDTNGIKIDDTKKMFTEIYKVEFGDMNKESRKFIKEYANKHKFGFPEYVLERLGVCGSKYKRLFKKFTDSVDMEYKVTDKCYELTFTGSVQRISVYYPVTLCEFYDRSIGKKQIPVIAYVNELVINDETKTFCEDIYDKIKVKKLKLVDYEPDDVLYILQKIDAEKVCLVHKTLPYKEFDYDEPSRRRQYKNPNVIII